MEKYYSVRPRIIALWMFKIPCVLNIYRLSFRRGIYKALHVYSDIAQKELHYFRHIITEAVRLDEKPVIYFSIHKKQVRMQRYKIFLIIAITVIGGILSIGCTRQVYVPVESVSVRTDTVYSAKVRVDSVIFRDSVAVIQKGDTVFMTKYRDRYRVREHTDTVYQSATDSVRIEVPVPVERELTRWEKVKMEAGGWAIGAGTALLVAVIALLIWIFRIKKRK